MTRTIKELVEAEVIYFISPLIDELLQQEKYREEFYHLTTSTDWDEAEKAISQNICVVQPDVDNLWGIYDKDNEYYTVEPRHDNKIEAIKQYFNNVNWDLCDYSCEVCEWWLVSEWLLNKLAEQAALATLEIAELRCLALSFINLSITLSALACLILSSSASYSTAPSSSLLNSLTGLSFC